MKVVCALTLLCCLLLLLPTEGQEVDRSERRQKALDVILKGLDIAGRVIDTTRDTLGDFQDKRKVGLQLRPLQPEASELQLGSSQLLSCQLQPAFRPTAAADQPTRRQRSLIGS
ncbi:hypothetical protein FJT64_001970 [Amphibalanus amphitrite]|uniref:Uncharacterized protein n=1 Tax=Amphibalanus amphitrite TaxID=1232801 RepID=A0A6A4WTB0_AMPAM|nr:hypothetical protein FJT64_001970 [Amphibalanus amphitrite]